jgi:hypothetical protein
MKIATNEEMRSACQPQDACREIATTVAKRSAPAPAELAQRRIAEPGTANEELQTSTYPVAHALESPRHGIDGDSRRHWTVTTPTWVKRAACSSPSCATLPRIVPL